jgi:glutaredoxin
VLGAVLLLLIFMSKTYAEKLKDPRWQKKRLEILQRDNFTCQHCKDTKTELHIHHEKYKGDPWDAPNETLYSLCKYCHRVEEAMKKIVFIRGEFIGTTKLKHAGAIIVIRNYPESGYVSYWFDNEDQYTGLEIFRSEFINGLIEFHHNQMTHGEGAPVF